MSRRKHRVVTITPDRVKYADDTITITEFRGGVEHVVRICLKHDSYFIARELASAGRGHVALLVERRACLWRLANETLAELGGAK